MMLQRKTGSILLLAVVVLGVFSACSASAPAPAATPSPTPARRLELVEFYSPM